MDISDVDVWAAWVLLMTRRARKLYIRQNKNVNHIPGCGDDGVC